MASEEPSNNYKNVIKSTLINKSLSSCLRNNSNINKQHLGNRTVSFPEDDNKIVTGYLEPVNPWEYVDKNKDVVISSYTKSCKKHGTEPIKSVLDQLEELRLDDDGERVSCLNLKGEELTRGCCEALEEVLKRMQFERINLEDTSLDDEASVALFDMIEYYEAATLLNISNNDGIGQRGWQACSRMLKRAKCLEQLECKNTVLSEQLIPLLSRALRLGTHLQVLKLENCSLSGRPIVVLVAALKLNTTLKELYLADNELVTADAVQLYGLLKCNTTLQLLDVSNNNIGDSGLVHLCDAIYEQSKPAGLSILVLWNNRLTTQCAPNIARVLRSNNTLEMLNIGHNDLKDEYLYEIKEALSLNNTLLRYGMQSTAITSDGAITLAHIIANNKALQRIDLRDNDLQINGLTALSLSLKTNTRITQLDVDDYPKNKLQMYGGTMEEFMSLVEEIRGYCSRNEAGGDESLLRAKLSTIAARKISLTCDTLTRVPVGQSTSPSTPPCGGGTFLQVEGNEPKRVGGRLRSPAPSPIPSPIASPSPTRTRFQVSKVCEDSPPESNVFFNTSTRFHVTTVSPKEVPPVPVFTETLLPVPPTDESNTKVVTPPTCQTSLNPSAQVSASRTRKLSSWMSQGIFSDSKAASGLEKLLGLFQNPFSGGRGGSDGNDEAEDRVDIQMKNSGRVNSDGSGGATWPQALLRPNTSPVQSPHSTSAPSLTPLTVIPPTG
ncbi:uncharacterized protein [Rhodnius prolixus]|uniref:uncharacterized protein n=1 Tax=Rhodnius prolixus TaxID=13249 RepID=UPI003D18ED24